jgi:transcription initiation factor IIE alpha subunit
LDDIENLRMILRRNAAVNRAVDTGWETATWKAAAAKLRAALALTVRERLQALEDLAELAERLAAMPRVQGQTMKAGPSSGR